MGSLPRESLNFPTKKKKIGKLLLNIRIILRTKEYFLQINSLKAYKFFATNLIVYYLLFLYDDDDVDGFILNSIRRF